MTNRHGLIAGATGTGKTRTLQLMVEQLSAAGVSVFAADVKGDLSGLVDARHGGRPGGQARGRPRDRVRAGRASRSSTSRSAASGPACRCARPSPTSGPSCSRRCSTRTRRRSRASRSSSTTPTRRACRCSTSPTCARCSRSSTSDAGKAELKGIGGLSAQTVGVLLRNLVGLETGGGNEFFGEPQFDVNDLLRTAPDGRGDHLVPRAAGRAGQAEALLDGADVAARRAVRGAARGRRPRQAEARASSSTRRTCCSTTRARRSSSR